MIIEENIHERDTDIIAEENTRSIILIEDDDLVRLSIGRFLNLYNYRIKKFASAEEALQSLYNADGDIIITDFNLPGLNGLELTKIIRKRGIKTPIVLISAIQGADFENTCLTHGIASVFTKPINIEELRNTIERLL